MIGGLFHLINSNDFPDFHEEGEAIVYVDDDSDTVHTPEPDRLKDLIQQEAGNSARWLTDNKLSVAGDKSKLLIVGTKQMRNQKLRDELVISVDGKNIVETGSECRDKGFSTIWSLISVLNLDCVAH